MSNNLPGAVSRVHSKFLSEAATALCAIYAKSRAGHGGRNSRRGLPGPVPAHENPRRHAEWTSARKVSPIYANRRSPVQQRRRVASATKELPTRNLERLR